MASVAVVAAVTTIPSTAHAANTGTDLQPVGSRSADEQRADSDPRLTKLAEPPKRTTVPADRYAMAGGCYTLATADGRYLTKSGGTYSLGTDAATAAPIHFQATELGRYLLWDADERFITHDSSPADDPSEKAEWTIDGTSNAFDITEGLLGTTQGWRFRTTTGCPEWPEIELNVTGAPFAGVSSIQETRGYIDDHVHQMATDFLGGGIHCGRPWDRYGVEYALKDCTDHSLPIALPEVVLSGNATHDPVGWPTFKDWPAPGSLTHEGAYYKWVERAWRGGQRIFVNLLVENEVLCVIYPNLSKPLDNVPGVTKTCNDMDQVRHQAKLIHQMQDYIDAQWGGPGRGWFRIVDTPEDARRIVNEGKLAVVLGTETSDIFNCSKAGAVTDFLGRPELAEPLSCTDEDLDRGLDELYDLGVRQMVITHKFDNAFGGAKGDHGFNGIATNLGNFLINGTFFRMHPCADGLAPDNAQLGPAEAEALPGGAELIDGLAQGLAFLPITQYFTLLPVYQAGDQCNTRGLTELGASMIRKMADRNMIVDVDHFNSKTRAQALDLLEDLKYSGVISSHSWADDNAMPRIYRLGGFVSPYAGGSSGFAGEWQKLTKIMDGRFFWGLGFGADINGLGAQGGPRDHHDENPVTYPFRTFGDVTVDQQHSGERVYDINTDGVAHYGLYPDWWQDLKMIKGEDILTDMRRGSEAYLQMWERAEGATNDACRQPELRRHVADFAKIKKGTSAEDVLYTYGQPHIRAGQTYRYCALNGAKAATISITFDDEAVADVSGTDMSGSGSGGGSNDDTSADGSSNSGDGATGNGSERAADGSLPDAGGMDARWPLGGIAAIVIGALMVANCRRLSPGGIR